MVIFTTQHVNAKNVTANFVCLYLFDHERKKERTKEIHYHSLLRCEDLFDQQFEK